MASRSSFETSIFRFRILPEEKNGQHVLRTFAHPYPFDENALKSMAQKPVCGRGRPGSLAQRGAKGRCRKYHRAYQPDAIDAADCPT